MRSLRRPASAFASSPWRIKLPSLEMAKPKIAVIISTTRATRFSEKPAKWIHGIAAARADMSVALIDLRDYPMPFFDEPASNAWVPSKNEVAKRWQKKVAEFDGYIFVTAEYNRSMPAVLKNALDYAYPEWNRKAAAYVGYGSVGAARSIEHLRLSCVELQMAPMRDRKSTRLNSSHGYISYAVFCLKKKNKKKHMLSRM